MVIFIGYEDNANVGYEFAQALKSIGVDAEAYTKALHGLNYEHQATLLNNLDDISKAYDSASYVVHIHSYLVLDPSGKKHNYKGRYVFHGGSLFRKRPGFFNHLFNEAVNASLIQTWDLMNLGAKNQVWMFPPIDTDKFQPDFTSYRQNGKLMVAHYPSSILKGSSVIIPVLQKLHENNIIDASYSNGLYTLPHHVHLRMKASCDVYVESLIPKEIKCREWGVSAMEAAALGKIVLTNFDGYSEYVKEYGSCPFFVLKEPEDIYEYLTYLASMTDDEILELKQKTRAWIETCHSRKATGQRLVDKVFNVYHN